MAAALPGDALEPGTAATTTLLATSGNLPVALTPLVGRDSELRELTELVATHRLVTITGTGGCGKTRLALAVAAGQCERFADGCWWADLASTSGRELPVNAVVLSTLGVPQSAEDSGATLVRHLEERSLLLVLDNCEHVAYEVAVLCELLLQRAPWVRVLATSREMVGVPGEHVIRLGGLRLDVPEGEAAISEAVQLFAQRASAVMPGFALEGAELAAASRLCHQLDGLPLAIELAAVRVGVLSVAQIAERLERDVGLLRHPSRTAPARQQTLVATLDWSHGLLGDEEQLLFRRLACFRGSFSLLAAEAVAAGEDLSENHVLGLIAALVGKSLLQVADRGVESRYRMLETVRQYGERRLAESPDNHGVRAGHAEFYLVLALHARAGLDGPDQVRWLDRLELENDNVRAALEWSLRHRPETGCHLAAAMWPFWYRRGHYNEGRHWLEEAAEQAPATSAPVQAGTLTAAGIFAFFQCDYGVARERLHAANALYEELGDRVGLATTLYRLGSIAREEARYADARALCEASLEIRSEFGDEVSAALCEDHLGFAAWLEGDPVRAAELCADALATFRRHGRRHEEASALINLGAASLVAGEREHAAAQFEESLAISKEIGFAEGIAWSAHLLAVALAAQHPERARALLGQALRGHVELGDRWRTASVLETVADFELRDRDPLQAALLLGAAAALREELGAPTPPSERGRVEATQAALERRLGHDRYSAAVEEGRCADLERVVQSAQWELSGVPPTTRSGQHDPSDTEASGEVGRDLDQRGLTDREIDVLRLVARGLTNREIGAELFISAGTAGVHVSNILRKLGVGGRVQAAGIAHEMGLLTD